MSDLQVILNRIQKLQAEREFQDIEEKTNKEKWTEIGFDRGLEWVENEIIALMKDKK